MLAERRYKVQYVLNPRNHSWTADTNNFGKKLMERMGWSKGKGLGRDEQGTTEHIRVTYKNDNKGMGYAGPVDDPVLHQNDFNELLLQLNQEKEPIPIKPESLSSLEKRSESTRRRVHYKKFTRGKDLSRYSAKDLECIVGSGIKKKKEEPEVKEEIQKIGVEGHSHGVETITGGLMADYFRKKMMERGLATPKVEYEKDEKDEDFGFVGFKMNGEEKEVEAESKKESKKKKKSKKKLGTEETDVPEDLGKTTFEKEVPNFAFVGFKMSEEQVDQPECNNPKKKKKKKKAKSENLEIPEHAKNVIEPDPLQKKDKRKKLKRKAGQECIDNILNSEAELHLTKKKKKKQE